MPDGRNWVWLCLLCSSILVQVSFAKHSIPYHKTRKATIYKMEHKGRAPYYQGPWTIDNRKRNIARGNLMVFEKENILDDLKRQLSYFVKYNF